jgi:glycerol-3-phosphate cytidylyltransferase
MTARCVITFGTFDLFHIGHLNLLRRARAMGTRLVVGVSTDALSLAKKASRPVFGEADRLAIVGALAIVDEAFPEESLEAKADYIRRYGAAVLVMGDDWAGRLDGYRALCEVVYLPRTAGISTSAIRARLLGGAG